MNAITGPDSVRSQRLGQMIRHYEKDLLRICCMYLRDVSLAEDAVQEAFIKAYKHMDSFRGESSEKTWLFSIAVNVCRDMRRNAWFRFVDRSVDVDALQIPVGEVDVTRLALAQEIMRLPRREVEAVLLYYYADIPIREIARTLHISEPAVSKRLTKARHMLKDALKGGAADE